MTTIDENPANVGTGHTIRRLLRAIASGEVTTSIDDDGGVLLQIRGDEAMPHEIQAVARLLKWEWIERPAGLRPVVVITDAGSEVLELLRELWEPGPI